ncbi:unnamed protein product [Mytilus edulis]|uniref:Novel STAND NTPase 3 domain-containing protein n=1 Tax=Mytilus edulis TaxID=6550 RepID=A0A8S3U7X0_MYTED|nr:unnamed protein product [Mytilus edulis]
MSTLVCDSIAKHVKTIRRCHLQAFPRAHIWDIINLLNCGTIQVNYDIILMHVGTNNVGTYEVADFDIAYNVLISTIEKLVKPHTVISVWKVSEAVFTFQCPVQSHCKHRADAICDSFDKYFCLYDRNEKKYNESCRDRPDVEKPGYKLIVAGSLQGDPCDHEFYQPLNSRLSGTVDAFINNLTAARKDKSYRNGTEKIVRSCRCDYTRGFDFITRPNNPCLCDPSSEDCSCFHRTCPTKYILSPDYECLNKNEWKLSFKCDLIATVSKKNDYVIVPARQPSDITQYYEPDTHQVFIIDDFIGKYAFDEADSALWEKEGPLLQNVLRNNDQIKVVLTCRKSVWHPEKCERFGFSAYLFDLDTHELRLTLSETRTIVEAYVEKSRVVQLNDQMIMMYTFLPLYVRSFHR